MRINKIVLSRLSLLCYRPKDFDLIHHDMVLVLGYPIPEHIKGRKSFGQDRVPLIKGHIDYLMMTALW